MSAPLEGIDTSVVGSDGWWFQRLAAQLQIQARECQALHDRYLGKAPLPWVEQSMEKSVAWFIGKARTNLERLIVGAVISRLRVVGLRTPGEADGDGDQEAWARWIKAGMPLVLADMVKMRASMGRAYIIVGQRPDGSLLVTAEDPRLVTAVMDPTDPARAVASLKMLYDDVRQEDVAYLYREGRLRVARRPRASRPLTGGKVVAPRFSRAFVWDDDVTDVDGAVLVEGASGPIDGLAQFDGNGVFVGGMNPVVPFVNEDGMAEFEPHIDLLDRISLLWLQLLTIIAFQAFRQRAMKGAPRTDPKTGEVIDYSAIFEWAPNALWNVPAGVEFWESQPGDTQGVILAIRDALKDLAAVSFTPLYSITPDVANGSAQGASLQREGQVFKVENHQQRLAPGLGRVDDLMSAYEGTGRSGAQVMWNPAERFSLAERGSAASQVKGILSNETIWAEILQLPPDMYSRIKTQLADDLLLSQQYAAVKAAGSAVAG